MNTNFEKQCVMFLINFLQGKFLAKISVVVALWAIASMSNSSRHSVENPGSNPTWDTYKYMVANAQAIYILNIILSSYGYSIVNAMPS